MQPLISIITVTYNAAKVLEPTMKSVAEQTFNDYEHIIVDGASTDDTPALAARYANPRLSVYSKPDNGIYHGMNRGLRYAKGQYVLFMNAGDRFASPDTLALFGAEAMKGADIIYGDTVVVDNDGNVLRPRHKDAPEKLTLKSYLGGMLVCHQSFMVRRAIAPEYDRHYKLSSDFDWCLRCIKSSDEGAQKNLHTVTTHYLDDGASERHKLTSLRERFDIMRRHFGLLPTLRAHLRFLLHF